MFCVLNNFVAFPMISQRMIVLVFSIENYYICCLTVKAKHILIKCNCIFCKYLKKINLKIRSNIIQAVFFFKFPPLNLEWKIEVKKYRLIFRRNKNTVF